MNICITNIEGAPQFIGGIKRVSATLGNQWQASGYNVSFITFCTSELHYDSVCGIPQFFLPNSSVRYCPENIEYFVEYINRNKIEILLNQFVDDREFSKLCIEVKERTGVKLVSSYHFADNHFTAIRDESFFCRSKPNYNIKAFILDTVMYLKYTLYDRCKFIAKESDYFSYICDNSDIFVSLSEKTRDRILSRVGSRYSTKLIAINNPNSFVNVASDVTKDNIVLWIGRVEYGMKRFDRIVSVWSKLHKEFPNWKLQVLGGGNVDHFKDMIRSNKIENIEFVGFVNPQEYYERAKIVAMTSCTEGLSMVLVEGQQNGCVPIAYDSFCALETIIDSGKSGVAVTPSDREEYVSKLRKLMSNEEYHMKLSKSAKESVKRFDANVIAKRWESLFNELLS